MTPPEYTIRPMTRADLDIAANWAAAEGWNPGLDDADAYWTADPSGFTLAFDRPFFPEDQSWFLKQWICRPNARGIGYLPGCTGTQQPCHRPGPGPKDAPPALKGPECTQAPSPALPLDRIYGITSFEVG